jgi:hypothetical protein
MRRRERERGAQMVTLEAEEQEWEADFLEAGDEEEESVSMSDLVALWRMQDSVEEYLERDDTKRKKRIPVICNSEGLQEDLTEEEPWCRIVNSYIFAPSFISRF